MAMFRPALVSCCCAVNDHREKYIYATLLKYVTTKIYQVHSIKCLPTLPNPKVQRLGEQEASTIPILITVSIWKHGSSKLIYLCVHQLYNPNKT